MPNRLMQYTCCLFVLISCIDRGDGRWKQKDKENLRHDIDLFKEISEKIEEEIYSFYEDYSEEEIDPEANEKDIVKYNIQNNNNTSREDDEKYEIRFNNDIPRAINFKDSKDTPNYNGSMRNFDDILKSDDRKVATVHSISNWPKFNELLLAMGTKYDWKNDRWLKVKRKEKQSDNKKVSESNRSSFSKLHKFSYSMVKLSKRKGKKTIVVAVSAVR